MKRFLFIALSLLTVAILGGCKGNASADAEALRQREDSIAQAKEAARIADSIAAEKAKIEAERQRLRKEKAAEDSIEIAKLMPQFSCIEYTENKDSKLYVIKGTSLKHNRNGAYMSITTFDDKPRDLLINIDYCGQDWIRLNNAVITLGDEAFDVSPKDEIQSNVENSMCSEWYTANCPYNFTDKLNTAENGRVKLIGDEGSRTITLSKQDIANMAKTVKLYNLLK